MSESRQQRRARERLEAKRQHVTGRITGAKTVLSMWRAYYDEVLIPRGVVADDPDTAAAVEWFRRAFYSGASAVFELVTRIAPDEISEDAGAAMLQRIYEELETAARGIADEPQN